VFIPRQVPEGCLFEPADEAMLTLSAAGLERWPITANGSNQRAESLLRIGPPQRLLRIGNWEEPSRLAAQSADGRTVAVGLPGSQKIVVFDPAAPGKQRQLNGYPYLSTLLMSPDGQWIVNSTWKEPKQQHLRLTNVGSGEVVQEFPRGAAA